MTLGIVGISEMQKCGLKYVTHSLGVWFELIIKQKQRYPGHGFPLYSESSWLPKTSIVYVIAT